MALSESEIRSVFDAESHSAGENRTGRDGTGRDGTGTGPGRDRDGTGTGPGRDRDGTGTGPGQDGMGRDGTGWDETGRYGTGDHPCVFIHFFHLRHEYFAHANWFDLMPLLALLERDQPPVEFSEVFASG